MAASRPTVDIVVPFVGSDSELEQLLEHLRAIHRGPQDTLTVVDNRPLADAGPARFDEVIRVPDVQSSYHARNRGAARGTAPWIVFLDADVEVEPGLLEGYFAAPVAPGTGLLAGAVEPTLPRGGGRVARYGLLRRHLAQEGVSTPGHEYALTANAAVRREAFQALGGFADGVRSAGDADFCFRARDSGWALERRSGARVRHPVRGSLKEMLRVFARYGSGCEWARERYPTFSPPTPLTRMLLRVAAAGVRVPLAAARGRHDDALTGALDPLVGLAFELGRFLPNATAPTWGDRATALRRGLRDRGRPAR